MGSDDERTAIPDLVHGTVFVDNAPSPSSNSSNSLPRPFSREVDNIATEL
jgi:hypothetical protein